MGTRWVTLLVLRWEWSAGGLWTVVLGRWVTIVSGWLTNVDVPLSLPAVLEVMDKRMMNLTLWTKVQNQPEKSQFGPKRRPSWFHWLKHETQLHVQVRAQQLFRPCKQTQRDPKLECQKEGINMLKVWCPSITHMWGTVNLHTKYTRNTALQITFYWAKQLILSDFLSYIA